MAEVVQTISADDRIWARSNEAAYFAAGDDALRWCKRFLDAVPESILDFGCGHGRVMRYLRAEYPNARITAAEIDHGAADFCASTFDAEPFYSAREPIPFDRRYDLIWSGSLFTHLDERRWRTFLGALASALTKNGVLVFTTSGRLSVDEMAGGATLGLRVEDVTDVVSDFRATGFGYASYPGQDYGVARCSPSWVCSALPERMRLLGYTEYGWVGRQDVVAITPR